MYFLLNIKSKKVLPAFAFFLISLSFSNASFAESYAQSNDPWIFVNRQVFSFNDYFDQLLVRPISSSYLIFLPQMLRSRVSNFFNNVQDINIAVNNALQWKFDDAVSDSVRVFINSTAGLAGFFDIASGMGFERHEEDFGQTLGRWGIREGPYIFLPVFGASNLRDTVGMVVDTAFNPMQYHDEFLLKFTLYFIDEIDSRSSLLAYDELITGDRYLFVREAYIQNRNFVVNDGNIIDEFGEF